MADVCNLTDVDRLINYLATMTEDGDAKGRISEIIESEFGLLDKLLGCGALTKIEIANIKCKATIFEKNDLLINYISLRNKHQDLMEALFDCRQPHVVNWMKANGKYNREFKLHWPLTKTQEEFLDRNQEKFVDDLQPNELLIILFTRKVINKRQRESFDAILAEYKRSEALLDTVRRFSQESYLTFKKCLRQSGNSLIADILEKDKSSDTEQTCG